MRDQDIAEPLDEQGAVDGALDDDVAPVELVAPPRRELELGGDVWTERSPGAQDNKPFVYNDGGVYVFRSV